MLTAISADEIRRRGSIRDSDVVALRAAYAETTDISAATAEALFGLHAATPIQDPSWADLFTEIISEYIVDHADPSGYLISENARWLIEQVSTFGQIETSTELALVLHVLDRARWTPPSLSAFALDQIRHAIETGKGPLRAGRKVPTGTIVASEVALAGRILCAFGRETTVPVTRREADALLAIHRSIEADGASPAWTGMLVRIIGSSVLAALGHAIAPRRELVDSREAIDDGLMSLLYGDDCRGDGARHGPATAVDCSIWRSARLLTPEERALVRLERQRLEIVTNEVIEETTATWLIEALARLRADDEIATALLGFIAREANRLPPELAHYARQRSIAA